MTADPIASIPYPILTGGADITLIMKPPIDAIGARLGSTSAVPHGKYRCATSVAIGATTWTKIPIDTATDLSTPAPDFTLSSGAKTVTVASARVYLLSASVSTSVATFAIRIVSGATVLAQTVVGAGVSLTQTVSLSARLAAGAVLSAEVYATGATSNAADSATSPCAFTVTSLGA